MAYFQYREQKIYYQDYGSGQPLLLLHGITNSGRAWASQIAPFVEAGFRLIVPDLPGHGASTSVSDVTTPAHLSIAMLSLLRTLGIERATWCGTSLGGTVAIEAAGAAPLQIDRLVICNSFVRTNTEALAAMSQQWKTAFRLPDGPVKRLETMWPLLVSEAFRASELGLTTFQTWHAQAAMANAESYCHITDGLSEYDATEILPELLHPCLVVASREDCISPFANSEDLTHLMPNATLFPVAGSAHLTNVDSAPVFNQHVIQFLRA